MPLNKLFTLRGRLFNRTRGKQVLQRAESHHCAVNTLGKLAGNFSTFSRFLQGNFFRKSPTESERSDQFSPGKIIKIIK